MATVAGHDHHPGARSVDLLHLATAIVDAFFVVPAGERTAASAAANLVLTAGVQINPIFQALIQNPARLFEKAMAEPLLGAAAVIAGVVISRQTFKPGAVQADAAIFDITDQKIENRDGFKFFQGFGIPTLQTIPGRQIGVPSLGP